jgi:hypothetical protein
MLSEKAHVEPFEKKNSDKSDVNTDHFEILYLNRPFLNSLQ